MKKHVLVIMILSALVTIYSCKSKKTQSAQSDSTTSSATTETPAAASPASTPKTYTVTITPDTVALGANRELLIKIKNLKAIELSDPDGGVTGIKLSYDFDATNNNKIGGSAITVNPADFRLELDNGTKITHDNNFSANVEPEATSTSAGNDFVLPKGTKPTALDLFFNDTRASLKMELK